MIPTPISIANAEHYDWGDRCDGWHLVRSAAVSVIEERMPPRAAEARHWHTRAMQFFYVLSGVLLLEVEVEQHELSRGMGLQVPSGTAHQARNMGEIDANFLLISSPPHQGDRRETTLGEV